MGAATATREGRRRRSDAERNVRAIVDAAVDVLARHPRASMQDVAAAAGLHRATVHRHFATRDDLVHAVRERALDQFTAIATDPALAEMEPGAALDRLTRRSLELGDRARVYRVAATFDEAGESRRAAYEPAVERLLERAAAAGAVRADLPPADLVTAWTGLVLAVLPRLAGGLAVDDAVGFVRAVLAMPAA